MGERYYEMLWNCASCGVDGLLAKSQRHCPVCGAAQDPAKRYFPPPDREVEVHGHSYVGVDWRCAYCDSPNGAAAAFCANCGAGKDGSRPVQRLGETPAVTPAPVAAVSRRPWLKILGGLLSIIAAASMFAFFSKHEESVMTTALTWRRTIEIERYRTQEASAWCSELPSGAYAVRRSVELKEKRQVEDGEECKDKRVDMGDGTFAKKQECTPRYREEPVMADKCHFRIDRWQRERSLNAQGERQTAPVWPLVGALKGADRGASGFGAPQLGDEREAARREVYTVQLKAEQGKSWSCELDYAKWQTLELEQWLKIQVRGTGGAVCETLR